MRFYLSFSPASGLILLFDDGQGLPGHQSTQEAVAVVDVSGPASPASPALLQDYNRRRLLTEFRFNRKAVPCIKCREMIAKGKGYGQLFPGGFLCEYCQNEAGQPIRAIVEDQA